MFNPESYNPNISPESETDKTVKELQKELGKSQTLIEELKMANQRQSEFVSVATHQIRGPLGAIKGYISLMLEGDYGEIPEGLKEPLSIILKSTDSLGKTVNDFLDVSRLDQGEMRYYLKDFDLTDLVKEGINEMKTMINASGLELRLSIGEGPFLVHSDKAKLKHVLINLIDNANKYTKSGWIEISLTRNTPNTILFSVKDSGVGIKPETLPKLFEKFSRDKDANKTNIHGTGLGLYVARKLVEARHGRIWAESEGEGKGSQFYVEMPGL
jgi:signal transduction histidine kinase